MRQWFNILQSVSNTYEGIRNENKNTYDEDLLAKTQKVDLVRNSQQMLQTKFRERPYSFILTGK